MKKYIWLIFFLVGIGAIPAVSQKAPINQAEMEAFMKNLQRQSDSIKKVLKDRGINTSSPQSIPASKPTNPQASNKGIDKIELPPRDSLKIRNIPKKNYSLQELAVYISDVHAQLAKNMPGPAASAKAIADKLNNDPAKLESAAIVAWKKRRL